MYSAQSITVISEYYNNFKGMCKEISSNVTTLLMANSFNNTCHFWQLYYTI